MSSMEEYQAWSREPSPAGSERRKLSYNPVGTWIPPVAAEEPVSAFEISKGTRICKELLEFRASWTTLSNG